MIFNSIMRTFAEELTNALEKTKRYNLSDEEVNIALFACEALRNQFTLFKKFIEVILCNGVNAKVFNEKYSGVVSELDCIVNQNIPELLPKNLVYNYKLLKSDAQELKTFLSKIITKARTTFEIDWNKIKETEALSGK